MDLLARLQHIDRRVLYALLAIAVSLPFLVATPVPAPAISDQTRGFYQTIEALAADPARRDKMVILSANFSASTAAENLTQAEVVTRHLMKRRLKFAIFDFVDPQGQDLAQQVATRLQGQYGYRYGADYVNWGFRPVGSAVPTVKAMVRDIPAAIGTDTRRTPIAQIPVMKGIRTQGDIGAIIEITGAASLPIWLGYFQRASETAPPVPTLFATTGVQAPEAFPLLKSGQLQGMLNGLTGAIEYETLLGERGFATKASASLSYAHFLIVTLIVLGNIGMLGTRARRRDQ